MLKINLREGWLYSKADLRLAGVITYIYFPAALKTLNCIGALLKSSFLLLNMSLQILCRLSSRSGNRLWIFFENLSRKFLEKVGNFRLRYCWTPCVPSLIAIFQRITSCWTKKKTLKATRFLGFLTVQIKGPRNVKKNATK